MRVDLIETFKIINEISNYSEHFFYIPPQTGNLLPRQVLKTKSSNQLNFFANGVVYFWN